MVNQKTDLLKLSIIDKYVVGLRCSVWHLVLRFMNSHNMSAMWMATMATMDRWLGGQVQNLSDNNRQIFNGCSWPHFAHWVPEKAAISATKSVVARALLWSGGDSQWNEIWKMSNFQQQKMQDWRKTSFLSITQSQNKWDQLRHRDSFCKGQLGSWIEAAQYFGEEKQ